MFVLLPCGLLYKMTAKHVISYDECSSWEGIVL